MGILSRASLAATVDAIGEAHFLGRRLPRDERQRAARWIAGRQGLAGAYCNLFAPTERDRAEGFGVFTGERYEMGASGRHVLGEEACRALRLLRVRDATVRGALDRATAAMTERLLESAKTCRANRRGMYCCARCSPALWRHLAVGLGQIDRDAWLAAAMRSLKAHRSGRGRWKSFPFYYTLLSLVEHDHPAVLRELRYTRPACEYKVNSKPKDDPHDARRRLLAERVLAKC